MFQILYPSLHVEYINIVRCIVHESLVTSDNIGPVMTQICHQRALAPKTINLLQKSLLSLASETHDSDSLTLKFSPRSLHILYPISFVMDTCSTSQIGPRRKINQQCPNKYLTQKVCYMTFTFEWKLNARSMNLTSFNPVYTFCIKFEVHFKSRNNQQEFYSQKS